LIATVNGWGVEVEEEDWWGGCCWDWARGGLGGVHWYEDTSANVPEPKWERCV
jgi:hypothetical protein